MRAEPHLLVVDREVRDAPPQLEQQLAGATVALVLLYGVGDGLLRQVVLQLEREHRKPLMKVTRSSASCVSSLL